MNLIKLRLHVDFELIRFRFCIFGTIKPDKNTVRISGLCLYVSLIVVQHSYIVFGGILQIVSIRLVKTQSYDKW